MSGNDLISTYKVKKKTFHVFFNKNTWNILSGKWEFEPHKKVITNRELELKSGENISIIGSRRWNEFTYKVRFKLLTSSLKPPEGGTIIYFLFKDIKNYYSIHFCHFKQKIEIIKRYKGTWSVLSERNYNFEIQKDYQVTIITGSGMHKCQIEGNDFLTCCDKDISKGCVGIGTKYCCVEFNHLSISVPLNR